MTWPARIAAFVGLLLGGFVFGVIGAFVQADRIVIEGDSTIVIPWGVVVVLLALVAVIRGGAWLVRARLGGAMVFIGWIAATLLLAVESPSGDLALSSGGRQMAYLLIGAILGAGAATFPIRESRITRTSDVA